MKFKFKFSNVFLGLATLAAIILSIVLWIFIMTNDQHFSRINQQSTDDGIARQQLERTRNKSMFDLYVPTNSYAFRDGKAYRLYDSKKNLPFEFSKDFRRGKVTKIQLISRKQANYELLLNNPNFIQLTYPDQITFNLFIKNQIKHSNREFNRIFVPSSNKWLYLGNDKNNKVYRLRLKNINFDRLRNYVKNTQFENPVQFVHLKAGYSAFYAKNTSWQVYSYLTTHQNTSYFVARLLGTSGVSSRTNKSGWTTYSLNYYTRLRVPKEEANDHGYLYMHLGKTRNLTTGKRMLNSVYYVHRLGLMEQNLRFFDADDSNVSYTNYIEGIPVFLNDHDAQINGDFSANNVRIAFNSTNFQIPVPFDGRTKELPATNQLISSLTRHGLREDQIDKIIVGFKVEKDNSHNSLVNLVPTYYVKAYGTWRSADEWQKQNMSVYQMDNKNEEGVN